MKKKIKITEEQYRQALSEGVTLSADVAATNGDIKQAVDKTKKAAKDSGVKMKDATIEIKGGDIGESRVITKRELVNNRMKVLKEHSQLYTFKDFIKNKSIIKE